MEKEKTSSYRFFRSILVPLFNKHYKTIVIGKENIPEDGPIIVCGNHIHAFDQCLPISATKRMIHYMAKKEYFEGKNAWFFRVCGCIPVDRANHGGNSKEVAMDVLNSGYALGIYPEGTRNSLVSKEKNFNEAYEYLKEDISKEEYYKIAKSNMVSVTQVDFLKQLLNDNKITLEEFKESLYNTDSYLDKLVKEKKVTKKEYESNLLLPFKFGTVSFASKSDATLVPYGIYGKYEKKGYVTAVIGKPFKVGNLSLEEANDKLYKEILKCVLEAKKIHKEKYNK